MSLICWVCGRQLMTGPGHQFASKRAGDLGELQQRSRDPFRPNTAVPPPAPGSCPGEAKRAQHASQLVRRRMRRFALIVGQLVRRERPWPRSRAPPRALRSQAETASTADRGPAFNSTAVAMVLESSVAEAISSSPGPRQSASESVIGSNGLNSTASTPRSANRR